MPTNLGINHNNNFDLIYDQSPNRFKHNGASALAYAPTEPTQDATHDLTNENYSSIKEK